VRVALDAQLAVGTATGIGEFVSGLARALPAAGVDVVALDRPSYDPWRFDRRVVWDQLLLVAAARRAGADLLHCASGTMPVAAPLPVVVTVHDVAWLRVQSHARWYARAYFGRLAAALYPRARRVMVDSAFSRDELTSLVKVDRARVDVVYPGVAGDVATIERRPDERPFVLVIGTVERRKRLETVIRAAAPLRELRVVAVGPQTDYAAECLRLAAELGLGERFELRGYVPRATVLDLLARAFVVAVPSIYEGFGYAAAWAMCAGVPVIAANASSLPEVLGTNGTLVDPGDADAWRAALERALADRAGSESRAASGRPSALARFSWSGAACAAARCYALALSGQ